MSNELLVIVGIILLVIVFVPGKGLIAKWKRTLRDSKRIRIEDALKHLYNCEYNGASCSIDSISGNLSLNRDDAAGLIQKLQQMGLVVMDSGRITLSADGREYALRIIRIHRLWERYLADETSISETDWHEQAEEIEHLLSAEEANELAAKIGNPLTDPHGDPIPTPEGKMPAKKSVPLTQLNVNDTAKIVHLEDEPKTIFAQIVAEGLYIGQYLRVIEVTEKRVKFEVDGDIISLAPIIAANVSVTKFADSRKVARDIRKLSDMKIGEKGRIVGISSFIRGHQRRRLLDLGIVPGTIVRAEIQSLGGDPTGYRMRGTTIAIRKKQASQIFIKETEE